MLSRQILSIVALAALVQLSGCGRGTSVNDDFVQKLPDEIVVTDRHAVTVSVVDAKTEKLLSQPVSLSLLGSLRDKAKDAFGKPVGELSTGNGITSFYLDATGSLPIAAFADGYFPGGTVLDVRDSLNGAQIQLVNLSNPPAGVHVGLATGTTSASGDLADSIAVTWAGNAGTQTVTVPDGASFKNASGTTLVGPLQISLVAFDIDSIGSLRSLPGGNTALRGTTKIPLQFLGVVGVSVVDSRKDRSATVSAAFRLTIPVPGSLENPLTSNTFAAGDSIDIVHLDETTGLWAITGSGAVSSLGSKLVVSFAATETGTWGVRVRQSAKGQAACAPAVFKLPGQTGTNVALSLFRPGFLSTASSWGYPLARANVLPGRELVLQASWGSSSVYEVKATYDCGDTVTLNLPKSATDVSETFQVVGICAQGGASSNLRGIDIPISRNGEFLTTVRTDINGTAIVTGLVANSQYSYTVQFGTNTVRGNFLAGGSPSVIATTVDCPEITGATGS